MDEAKEELAEGEGAAGSQGTDLASDSRQYQKEIWHDEGTGRV